MKREKKERGARWGWKEGGGGGQMGGEGGREGGERAEGRGRSRRKDLFLIDSPRSPRPLSHVIIGRVSDLRSLRRGCVISSARSCVCAQVYFFRLLTCK